MPTPLTIEFIGTRADSAESLGNYTATKVAGGGGGPAASLGSLHKQGSESIAMNYPTANRLQFLHFDGGAAASFDFSAGGAEENQLVWVWLNSLLAPTSTGTITAGLARGGLGVVITNNATITNSWAAWTIFGLENYPGGWQRLVIDPSTRPTQSGGSFSAASLSSIRGIGIFFVADVRSKGGGDAVIIDAIDVGSGLRIYGSGTSQDGFGDLLAADEGTLNNQYGAIKTLESTDTILEMQGYLEIGSGNNAGTVFNDINKVITFNNPQYIDTFGVVQFINSIPTEFQRINIVGNTTSGTEVNLGIKVGDGDTARGRNGVTFLGNSDYRISLDVEDEPNVNVKMYGTTIRGFDGSLTWPADSGHAFIGSTIDGSAQFNGDSGIEIRNSTFQNATGLGGSFLWNSGTDVKNSNFVANTNVVGSGVGIEHPFSGTFIYDNLQFSQNDFDINFSLATSGDLLIQATNTANPATATSGNVNSTVTIENTVVLTLTDIITGSEVRIYQTNTTNELQGIESVGVPGTFLFTYNFTGDFHVDIVVMSLDYKYFRTDENLLTSASSSTRISQIFDRNYENP